MMIFISVLPAVRTGSRSTGGLVGVTVTGFEAPEEDESVAIPAFSLAGKGG